jgi:hypothetical protein
VPSRRGLRLTAVIAAGVCVLAIAAGAIVFSYSGVRDLALTAGLSPRLARFYPLVFDAVLIVACAAAVTLRGVLRGFAWLVVLVVIGAIATADTVHAMSITVPQRSLEATIAIAPWVVLLTGLTLLDAMLRRAPRRKSQAVGPVSANGGMPAAGSAESTAGLAAGAGAVPLSTLLRDSPPASGRRARAAASRAAADAGRGRITASQPTADTSPQWAPASEPTGDGNQHWAPPSEPTGDTSPQWAPPSEPTVDTSPQWAPASEPTGDGNQQWAPASEPTGDGNQHWAPASEPTGDGNQHWAPPSEPTGNTSPDWVSADQPEATASLPQTGADPVSAEPREDGSGEG